MILDLRNVQAWYAKINKINKKHPNKKVIIFVSISVDSLTSLRIIVGLFKSDVIPYEIIPIQNYSQMIKEIKDCEKSKEDICGFVFINCIGETDLTDCWFCKEYNIVSLIAEKKRPIHHKNLHYEGTNITIIDDGQYDLEYCPTENEMQLLRGNVTKNLDEEENNYKSSEKALNFENLDEINYNKNEDENNEKNDNNEEKNKKDDDKNEDNNEEKNDLQEKPKKKIIRKKEDLENFSDSSEKNELDEIADEVSSKTGKQSLNKENTEIDENQQKQNEEIEKITNARIKVGMYYNGTYNGLPSAYIFYHLSKQLHKDSIHYLWYLIISITDEFLRYHLSEKKYQQLCTECNQEAIRLEKRKLKEDNTFKKFKPSTKEIKTIKFGSDYRLCLYRHWNLYDSFIYSNYTLGVLNTWKEPGKAEVLKIFAFMGIPLEEAKQKYNYMTNESKETFKEKIYDVSRRFDLSEIIFHSFLYQFDNNTEMSASDCVYLISCLIETPFEDFNKIEIEDDDFILSESENENDDESSNKENLNEENDKIKNDELIKLMKPKENLLKKFWMAYKFLSLKQLNMKEDLVNIAIKFQKALTTSATDIVDKNMIKDKDNFRFTVVSGGITNDSKYFKYPGNLEKLCICICEVYKLKKGKKFQGKPYLLAYIDNENIVYNIIGYLGCNKNSDDEKNNFHLKFDYSTKKKNIEYSYNYATGEIITIKKDDLYPFIEEINGIK